MLEKLAEFHIKGLPPTINHMYMRGHHTVYKNENARKWQENTVTLLKDIWDKKSPLTQNLELIIYLFSKGKRKWDIDNRIKAVQDCLQLAGVIENDNQIDILHIQRKAADQDSTQIFLFEVKNEND